MSQQVSAVERFWSKVKPPLGIGECWEWMAAKNGSGYGFIRIDRKDVRVHRYAYESVFGAIPEGMVIDHLCRNRGCVNPYHMEVVTNRENILRGTSPSARAARKTHCSRGHPLSGDNLMPNALLRGVRRCKKCDYASEWRQRQKLVTGVKHKR